MNNLLRKVTKLLLGLSLAAGVGVAIGSKAAERVDAEDEVYKTVSFSSSTMESSVSSYTATWTNTSGGFSVELVNFNNNNKGWNYVKTGNKSSASVGTITTVAAIDDAITKVDVTIDGITATNVNSIKLYSSNNGTTWSEEDTFTKATGTQSGSISSPTANLYYKIEFDCKKGSSNGLVTVSKIEFYHVKSANSKYTVTYDLNGGSGTNDIPEDNTEYSSGATVTVLGIGDVTKTGYSFINWSDGTNTYDEDDTFEITANVTLTAQWYHDDVISVVSGKESNEIYTGAVLNLSTCVSASGDGALSFSVGTVNYLTYDAGTTTITADSTNTGGPLTITAYKGSESCTFTVTVIERPATGTFELFEGSLVEGDYVLYYNGYLLKAAISSNRFENIIASPSNDQFVNPDSLTVWHIAQSGEYWTLYNEETDSYAGGTTTKNQGALLAEVTNYAKWTCSSDSNSTSYDFQNYGRANGSSDTGNKYLRQNGANGWACYASGTGAALSLYKLASTDPAITVSMTSGSSTLSVGETATLVATKINGATGTIQWSNDTGNVTIGTPVVDGDTSTVVVTADAVGSDTVTASLTGGSVVAPVDTSFTITSGTLAHPYTVSEARAAIDAGSGTANVYATGIVSEIVTPWGTNNYQNITFNITANGEVSSTMLQAYRCVSGDGDASAIQLGDTVVVYGSLTKYQGTYEFGQGCSLVSRVASTKPMVRFEVAYRNTILNRNITQTAIGNNLGGSSISYSSGNLAVATVNSSTGEVSPVSKGDSVITASATVDGFSYTSTYTLHVVDAMSVNSAITLINGGQGTNLLDNYVVGYVCSVGSLSSGSLTYYISDDGTETNKMEVYKGKGLNGADFEATTDLTIGDRVVVNGNLTYYESDSINEISSGSTIISIQKVGIPDPTTLSLDTATLTLEQGEDSTRLTFTTDSPSATFAWYSENTDLATVSDGVVHAVSNSGTVKIYVYFDTNSNGSFDLNTDLSAYCSVTLTPHIVDYSSITYGGTGVKVTSSNASTLLANGKKIIMTYDDSEVAGSFGNYIEATSTSVTFDTANNKVTIGDGTSEITALTILELETSTNGFYLKTKDGKYLSNTSTDSSAGNFSKTDTATTEWVVSEDGIYDYSNQANATIMVNPTTTPDRFKPYKSSFNNGSPVVLYSFDEYTDEAKTYADLFLESGVCGANDNTKADSSTWLELEDTYENDLSTGAQNVLKVATANKDSSDSIQKCLAKYDRVIYLHYNSESLAYPDFMNRVSGGYVIPLQSAGVIVLTNAIGENTNTIAAIVIISLVSVTAIGGYFFIKRREEN